MTTCHKKKYSSWRHAGHDAKALRWKGYRREHPYFCKHCKAWHVGERLDRATMPRARRYQMDLEVTA